MTETANIHGTDEGNLTIVLPLGKASWPDHEEVRLTYPHDFTFKDVERVVDHQKRTHVVYFIFCAGFVKICTTSNLKRRLMELQIGAPWQTRIVGLIPGGRATELFLHFFFRDDSAGGEWFIMSDQIRQIISEMAIPQLNGALEKERARIMPNGFVERPKGLACVRSRSNHDIKVELSD